jgi:hypothetical protein
MTENALINVGDSSQTTDMDTFRKATQSGTYLPRLQLMTSQSEKCKKGDFPINHYALINDQHYTDLGGEVDVLVIAFRPKAIEIGDEIIAVFDVEDPVYAEIAAKSELKDSGCMYGVEYLVWIPEQHQFATFFMGTKSSRREAANMHPRLQKGATLTAKLIDPPNSKHSWYAPQVLKNQSPITEIPDEAAILEELERFKNPPKSEVEKAESSADDERAR